VTPSWLNSVPSNYGDSAAGTIKADEWRTLATVHLPLALISLWGGDQVEECPDGSAAKLRAILDHTMLLVAVVSLACRRAINKTRADEFLQNLTKYIEGLKALHPNLPYVPNHHAAFHIYDFLLLFGPVRSWWCFPFERLIGHLQRLPSNHKFGKVTRLNS
jgi:hypothetical protein